jgi:thiamine-phosphate pyrophosphorylase
MVLYYITDRTQFPGTESDQRRSVLGRIASAAAADIDYIQLREKDLTLRELEGLAREALKAVRDHGTRTRLLINSRSDVALAVGADGVHLTAADFSPSDARAIWATSARETPRLKLRSSWIVGVSCHSALDVRLAESHGADFAVLAPIFEKTGINVEAVGLEELRRATRHKEQPDTRVEAGDQRASVPVLALGGITLANTPECILHGASGVAGIRLFQQGNVAETVKTLRQQI